MTRKETRDPKKMEPVKIEWNWDLDDRWVNLKSTPFQDQKSTLGEEGRFQLKGRCRRCWGGLIAKTGPKDAPTAIRCRVCGILLEGDAAEEEYRGMSDEVSSNIFNLVFNGEPFKYRDGGRFVNKVFPHIDREPEDKFHQRIKAEASKPAKKDWFSRREFPPGAPGFLVLQARALMSGVERLPREVSVARFPDLDLHDDGSATVYWSKEELGEHTSTSEYELMKRLGSAMNIAMMAAFAPYPTSASIRSRNLDHLEQSPLIPGTRTTNLLAFGPLPIRPSRLRPLPLRE